MTIFAITEKPTGRGVGRAASGSHRLSYVLTIGSQIRMPAGLRGELLISPSIALPGSHIGSGSVLS